MVFQPKPSTIRCLFFFYTTRGTARLTISPSSKPTTPFLLRRFSSSIVGGDPTIFSPLLSSSLAHHHHSPSHQACYMSVSTSNSTGVAVAPSSSPTATTTPTMVGPLLFRHDPGRYICRMDTQGVHFVSGKAVLDCYLQTLASVVGSVEEAKRRIYFVSCAWNYFCFGANIDELTSTKLETLPGVSYVIADDHFEARNKSAVVRSITKFSPLNWGNRLVDMFRYHESSKHNIEGVQDPGHWLVKIREPADGFSSDKEVVDSCIDLLAAVVGRKEAIKKIYAVWCTKPYGFGAEIDMGTLKKLEELSNLELLPDHACDLKKDGILRISSSPVGFGYWFMDDTYFCCEDIIDSDEDDLDSDEDGFDYDEKDTESDVDNIKSDDPDRREMGFC